MVKNTQARLAALAIALSTACARHASVDATTASKKAFTEIHLPEDPAGSVHVACRLRVFGEGVHVAYSIRNQEQLSVWVKKEPLLIAVEEQSTTASLVAGNSFRYDREGLPVVWLEIPPSTVGQIQRQGSLGDGVVDYSWASNRVQDVVCAVPYWVGSSPPTAGTKTVARSAPVRLMVSHQR